MARKSLRVAFLERIPSEYGEITVARASRTGAIIYAQGDVHQSESDGQGVSLSAYIHAIYGLVRQSGARRALMIGVGGGALATMLSDSGAHVTLVDVNPVSPYVARRYFGLPDSAPFHVEDGAAYLARGKVKFDCIVLDAYHSAEIPEHLTTPDFFRLAARRLTKRGVLIANLFVRDDARSSVRRLGAAIAEALPNLRILDEPGALDRNAILMAGETQGLAAPWLEMRPAVDADDIRAELKRLAFQPL